MDWLTKTWNWVTGYYVAQNLADYVEQLIWLGNHGMEG